MPTETVDDLLEQLRRLKIQETTVLNKLYQARTKEKGEQGESRNSAPPAYKKGDRVQIRNKISKPFTRRANTGDRDSTVQYSLTNDNVTKVFLKTDNGFETWRLEKNLERILTTK